MSYPCSFDNETVVCVKNLQVSFEEKTIFEKLSLDIKRGEILGIAGASGSGKSVLMRAILGLEKTQSGKIELFNNDSQKISPQMRQRINMRVGVLFQPGALFSSLDVMENVQVPMREYLDLSQSLMNELAMLKISLAGLPEDAARKFPSELSGGMTKRAALARALALDPELLFLDEPTAGLDPIAAAEFDDLVIKLRNTSALTVYMVTHDLDSLFTVCDRIAVLGNKTLLQEGTIQDMLQSDQPWIKSYFRGKRARRIPLHEKKVG